MSITVDYKLIQARVYIDYEQRDLSFNFNLLLPYLHIFYSRMTCLASPIHWIVSCWLVSAHFHINCQSPGFGIRVHDVQVGACMIF
jgi:hypothetical protein